MRIALTVRTLALIGLASLALSGCSFLNPYSPKPTYAQGERPSIAFASVLGQLGRECDSDDERSKTDCKPIGKIIQTRPDSNQSYQFFRYWGNDIKQVVTCASPAEGARALNVSGSVGVSIATAANKAASAAGSSARAESITVIAPSDAPTHFVAAASFYNCLA